MLKPIFKIVFCISFQISFGQNTFYVVCDNHDLILADFQSCTQQILCNTNIDMFDIALTPSELVYTTDGKRIYEVDINTCSYNLITPDTVPSNGQWINSLVALNNQYLFAASTDAILYKIDLNNGTSFVLDTIKEDINDSISFWYSSGGDLTWYKGKLLLVSAISSLVEIELDDNFETILDVEEIGYMSTPSNSIYGAITIGEANCLSDDLKVLAFENTDVYTVNPINAAVQMSCPIMFNCSVFGAASLTESQNQDYSSEIEFPNIFTPNNDNINDKFIPLMSRNIQLLDLKIFNRWGNLIYYDNSINFQWDGKDKKGNNLNEGVYYYVITVSDICGEEFSKTGYITLLR